MDLVYHKAKSQKQKRQNRLNREELLGNQAFQPINAPITLSDNSNDCEQTVEFMEYCYNDKTHTILWSKDDIEDINRALADAIIHLDRAIEYLDGEIISSDTKKNSEAKIKKYKIILDAVQQVRGVLQGTKTLQIFPYNDEESYAKAQQGYHQISINMNFLKAHENKSDNKASYFYALAKTFIHEAFHIIGGCLKGADGSCGDSVSKEVALNNIYRKESIKTMQADDFAQFVMQC